MAVSYKHIKMVSKGRWLYQFKLIYADVDKLQLTAYVCMHIKHTIFLNLQFNSYFFIPMIFLLEV